MQIQLDESPVLQSDTVNSARLQLDALNGDLNDNLHLHESSSIPLNSPKLQGFVENVEVKKRVKSNVPVTSRFDKLYKWLDTVTSVGRSSLSAFDNSSVEHLNLFSAQLMNKAKSIHFNKVYQDEKKKLSHRVNEKGVDCEAAVLIARPGPSSDGVKLIKAFRKNTIYKGVDLSSNEISFTSSLAKEVLGTIIKVTLNKSEEHVSCTGNHVDASDVLDEFICSRRDAKSPTFYSSTLSMKHLKKGTLPDSVECLDNTLEEFLPKKGRKKNLERKLCLPIIDNEKIDSFYELPSYEQTQNSQNEISGMNVKQSIDSIKNENPYKPIEKTKITKSSDQLSDGNDMALFVLTEKLSPEKDSMMRSKKNAMKTLLGTEEMTSTITLSETSDSQSHYNINDQILAERIHKNDYSTSDNFSCSKKNDAHDTHYENPYKGDKGDESNITSESKEKSINNMNLEMRQPFVQIQVQLKEEKLKKDNPKVEKCILNENNDTGRVAKSNSADKTPPCFKQVITQKTDCKKYDYKKTDLEPFLKKMEHEMEKEKSNTIEMIPSCNETDIYDTHKLENISMPASENFPQFLKEIIETNSEVNIKRTVKKRKVKPRISYAEFDSDSEEEGRKRRRIPSLKVNVPLRKKLLSRKLVKKKSANNLSSKRMQRAPNGKRRNKDMKLPKTNPSVILNDSDDDKPLVHNIKELDNNKESMESDEDIPLKKICLLHSSKKSLIGRNSVKAKNKNSNYSVPKKHRNTFSSKKSIIKLSRRRTTSLNYFALFLSDSDEDELVKSRRKSSPDRLWTYRSRGEKTPKEPLKKNVLRSKKLSCKRTTNKNKRHNKSNCLRKQKRKKEMAKMPVLTRGDSEQSEEENVYECATMSTVNETDEDATSDHRLKNRRQKIVKPMRIRCVNRRIIPTEITTESSSCSSFTTFHQRAPSSSGNFSKQGRLLRTKNFESNILMKKLLHDSSSSSPVMMTRCKRQFAAKSTSKSSVLGKHDIYSSMVSDSAGHPKSLTCMEKQAINNYNCVNLKIRLQRLTANEAILCRKPYVRLEKNFVENYLANKTLKE